LRVPAAAVLSISRLRTCGRPPSDCWASPEGEDSGGSANISWPANWDQDNGTLTYTLFRDDNLTTPRYTVSAASQPWNRPTLTYHDTGLVAGKTYLYWVRATDSAGNTVRSANTSITG
jgi:hypothetical protein